ncbi:MAG: abortive infection family protein [Planctomycetota bacterium]
MAPSLPSQLERLRIAVNEIAAGRPSPEPYAPLLKSVMLEYERLHNFPVFLKVFQTELLLQEAFFDSVMADYSVDSRIRFVDDAFARMGSVDVEVDSTKSDLLTRPKARSARRVVESRQRVDRRSGVDHRGQITAAQSELETVCKHLLDRHGISYGRNDSLSKLVREVVRVVQVEPLGTSRSDYKAIGHGFAAMAEGIAGVRRECGDAHGTGTREPEPSADHAKLIADVARAISEFFEAKAGAPRRNTVAKLAQGRDLNN